MSVALQARSGDKPMDLRPPRYSGTVLVCGLIVAIIVLFGNIIPPNQKGWADVSAARNAIPPTFEGIRFLYGLTLAVLAPTVLFTLSAIRENVTFLLNAKHAKWHEPAKVAVLNETLIYLGIVCGIAPDAVILFVWGETSTPSTSYLAAMDRALDLVAGVLIIAGLMRRLRLKAIALYQLQRDPIPVDMWPTWHELRPKLMVGAVTVLLSFGVAFGK